MKKLAVIAAGAVLLGAAGWSALWFAGRGAVGERLDAEIARLVAHGYGIAHGGREIGGFPQGYRVTYRDVVIKVPGAGGQEGGSYHLPEIVAEVAATDVDRVVTRFPGKFRLDLPVAAETRARYPGLPERILVEIEADGLAADIDGLLSAEREMAITARSILMVSAGPDQTSNIAVELKGVGFTGTLPRDAGAFPVTSVSTVDRIEYAIAVTNADASPTALEGALNAVRMTAQTDIAGPSAWVEMFTGGTGTSNMAYQTGASDGAIRAAGGPAGREVILTFAAGSTAGTVAIADGRIRLDAASQANRFALTVAPGAEGAEDPSYGADLRAIEFGYAVPLAPSDAMSPVILRLALDQATPNEALWTLLDVNGKLPRGPARLVIDLEGTARVTAPLTEQRPGAAPPFELGNFSIKAADLTALGAGVTARGDVEFLQPIQQPIGKVTVTLTNAARLLGNLAEAGLIDPGTAQTAMLMADGLTVPGAGAGERVAEIEMSLDGITVNGMPVGR
jgi:hypothetical protein